MLTANHHQQAHQRRVSDGTAANTPASSAPIQSSIRNALTANQQTIRVSDDSGNTYKLILSQDQAYPNHLPAFPQPDPTTTAAPTSSATEPEQQHTSFSKLFSRNHNRPPPVVGAPPPSPPLETDLPPHHAEPVNNGPQQITALPPLVTLTVPSPPINPVPSAPALQRRANNPSSSSAKQSQQPQQQQQQQQQPIISTARRNSASSLPPHQHQHGQASSSSSVHSWNPNAPASNIPTSPLVQEPQSINSTLEATISPLRTGDVAFDQEIGKQAEQIRRAKRQKEKDAQARAADGAAQAPSATGAHGASTTLLTRARTFRRDPDEVRAERDQTGRGEELPVLVGNLIGEDHVNYVLMYNMLTGIRIGVSRCEAKIRRPLTDADYRAKHKFTFDIIGNELTPSAKYDFKFKDYAPWVFRELREYFHLDPADYLLSLTAKYILSELGSPGKSGSFFYFSRDYRFIIKTIRHAEHKFLRTILKDYHEHVKANPHTLLSRFYGLHRVKLPHGRKIHFVIMNNLFPPHRDIHETYDLKGSAIGREYPEEKAKQKKGAVLKDLNWVHRQREIELGAEKFALFQAQLKSDVALLERLNIMDYSLLIGLHDMRRGNTENLRQDALQVFQPETDVHANVAANVPASGSAGGASAAAVNASLAKAQRPPSRGPQRRQSQTDTHQLPSSTSQAVVEGSSSRPPSRAGTIDGSMLGHTQAASRSSTSALGHHGNASFTGLANGSVPALNSAGQGQTSNVREGSSSSTPAPFAGLKRSFTVSSALPTAGAGASGGSKHRQTEKDAFALREAVRRSDPKALSSVTTTLPDHDASERRHFLFYQDEGGFRSTDANNQPGQMIYYLGVIDLFTPYTSVKRGEHFFKGLTQNKKMISAVPPKEYAARFINFLVSVCSSGDKSLRPKME